VRGGQLGVQPGPHPGWEGLSASPDPPKRQCCKHLISSRLQTARCQTHSPPSSLCMAPAMRPAVQITGSSEGLYRSGMMSSSVRISISSRVVLGSLASGSSRTSLVSIACSRSDPASHQFELRAVAFRASRPGQGLPIVCATPHNKDGCDMYTSVSVLHPEPDA